MIPPQAIAIGGALALIAGFFGGWTARDWKADSDQLAALNKAEASTEKARQQGQQQGAAYADLAAQLAGQRGTDRTTIERYYQNAPAVSADCAAPAPIVRLLENSVSRANAAAAGQPGATLPPAPDAASAASRPAPGSMGS